MPPVPLAISAHKRADAFTPEALCVNFFLEVDKSGASPDNVLRLQRPGLTAWLATSGTVRGLFQQDGVMDGDTFAAVGTGLSIVTATSTTPIGGIGGLGRVPFAANYEKLFFLSGVIPYTYRRTGIVPLTMPDDREVVDIDTINNFLILAGSDGRFYWLEPGSDAVDALDFATAESAPDGLVAARTMGDEIFFFGKRTTEVWQPTGDLDAPFLRAGGRTITRGAMARDTVHRFDNSLIWVGDDAVVYRLGNVPQRISDHGIEERLRNRTGEPSAMVLEHDGHKFYVLKIPGQGSYAYDPASPAQGVWPEFLWATGTPHVSVAAPDGWLVGCESGDIFLLDPESNADGEIIMTRRLTGSLSFMGRSGRQDSLSIGVGSSDDFTLKVRWKDGQDDFPAFYEELEARAPMDVVNLYRLGTPDQPFRTFDILVDEDVKVRIAGAMANEAWQ